MIRIALFTTLFVLSAHIAGSGITSVGAVSTDTIQEQNVSGIASGDWVENDLCYLSNVSCDWKFTAPVTKYLWTGYRMANGEFPREGFIACPREFSLGSVFEIDGIDYICGDRTGKKYNGRFDIYTDESYEEAMKFGKQHLVVMKK